MDDLQMSASDQRLAELGELGPLAARYADETLLSTIQGVHQAVAARAFRNAGPLARPAQVTHDAVSKGVYGAIRGAGKALGAVAGAVASAPRESVRAVAPSLFSDSSVGAPTLAAINGLIGDRLEEENSALSFSMSLRFAGRRIETERSALERTYPEATDRIAIFLHGLMEVEEAWGPENGHDANYGARLAGELGYTPVYLRYNTGLRICENGRQLSWLLDELRREWPVEVREIVLIGHSMGGLVARSACHEAQEHGRPWLGDTRHLICIGAPNRGSWLEKAVNTGGWALTRVPESKPFGDFLNLRSMGIRDLRFGFVRDADWADRDVDALHRRDETEPIAPCAGVEYHYVTGSLRVNPRHPLNTLFGDGLVDVLGGTGPRLVKGSRAGTSHHIAGAHHFRLLNDPRVYTRIRGWLERPLLTA